MSITKAKRRHARRAIGQWGDTIRFWFIRFIWIACTALLLITLILPLPATAQTPPQKADVVFDGRVLFQLGSIENISAEERANFANRALWQVLENAQRQPVPSPIRVRMRQQDGLVTLRANGRHLLTVTSGDLMAGVLPQERAALWADILQRALDRAQMERQPAYQRRMAWVSLGVVAIALLSWVLLYNVRRWLWRRQTRRGKLPMWILPSLLGAQVMVWLAAAIYNM